MTGRMRGKQWSDLTGGQRAGILVLAGVELALTAASLADLARRPAEQVRGPRALWAAAVFVQPVGPVAYLLAGRQRVAPRRLRVVTATDPAPS